MMLCKFYRRPFKSWNLRQKGGRVIFATQDGGDGHVTCVERLCSQLTRMCNSMLNKKLCNLQIRSGTVITIVQKNTHFRWIRRWDAWCSIFFWIRCLWHHRCEFFAHFFCRICTMNLRLRFNTLDAYCRRCKRFDVFFELGALLRSIICWTVLTISMTPSS